MHTRAAKGGHKKHAHLQKNAVLRAQRSWKCAWIRAEAAGKTLEFLLNVSKIAGFRYNVGRKTCIVSAEIGFFLEVGDHEQQGTRGAGAELGW